MEFYKGFRGKSLTLTSRKPTILFALVWFHFHQRTEASF